MRKLLFLSAFLVGISPVYAANYNSVPGAPVAICDPDIPSDCFKPNANGSININGAVAVSTGSINTIPTQGTSTEAAGTTSATPSTYTQVLPQAGGRLMCLIQNKSANVERIFLGTTGSATNGAALQLASGATFACSDAGGTVATDAIQINSDTASQAFVVISR